MVRDGPADTPDLCESYPTVPSVRSSVPAANRLHTGVAGLLAIGIVALVASGAALVVHRHGDDSDATPRTGASTAPKTGQPSGPGGPTEPGLPVTTSTAIRSSGHGHGLSRLIPCYTVTSHELSRILNVSMAVVGQRAAGENGGGLSGVAREDCFWFANQPDGPYVV